AMKKPIPAPTANFSSVGIALTIFSRSPEIVKQMNTKPETRTPASAVCQGIPHCAQTV
ncbi:chordin variant 3, partial [Listeria monocytogenes FSL F2-208]